jgi:hypothetical protein
VKDNAMSSSTDDNPPYASYLLRLWHSMETAGGSVWHGEVEHIQSGQRQKFTSLEAMLKYLNTEAEEIDKQHSR